MEISYWQSRWEKDNTGWHMNRVYPPLPEIWSHLSLEEGCRVLVPLCGKSLDMKWLADRGCRVTGVEVSQKALQEYMNLYRQSFSEHSSHGFTIYRSNNIELWEGDFLKFPPGEIPTPHLIYDKAALVALPPEMREEYGKKVRDIASGRSVLLVQTFEYPQQEMNGPPFSVDKQEIKRLFGDEFTLELLHEESRLEEMEKFRRRGLHSYFLEKVYLLKPN